MVVDNRFEENLRMDKDRVKGKMSDVRGRIKRQAGEWTGDENLQAEGMKDQAKGKMQNVAGKVKDAARGLKDDVERRRAQEKGTRREVVIEKKDEAA
jgi:uncharacterized protein YjbJ (UPF0337 family)